MSGCGFAVFAMRFPPVPELRRDSVPKTFQTRESPPKTCLNSPHGSLIPPPVKFGKERTGEGIIHILKVLSGNEVSMKKLSKVLCVVLALLTVAAASSASASISDAITGVGFKKAK